MSEIDRKEGSRWDRFRMALSIMLERATREAISHHAADDVADRLAEWIRVAVDDGITDRQCPACGRIAKRGSTVVNRNGSNWCPVHAPPVVDYVCIECGIPATSHRSQPDGNGTYALCAEHAIEFDRAQKAPKRIWIRPSAEPIGPAVECGAAEEGGVMFVRADLFEEERARAERHVKYVLELTAERDALRRELVNNSSASSVKPPRP